MVDNISIPETVNSIQINKKVRNVQLEGESNFVLLDGCLYDKNKTTLIKVLANNEETIPIVSSVVSIGPWAFSWCNSLEYLCIPSTVTNIGSGAFYLCNNLEKVYIDNLSAWCGIDFNNSNPFPLDYSLYLNDGLVTSVTIPDSVTAINDYAFCGCSSITNVIIPESVTKIGICSFGYCSNLESISIPETLTSIGTHAFKTCNEIKEIIIPHSITYLGNSILEGVTTDMRVVYCGTPDELDEIISESNMTSGSNAKLFYMSEDLFEIDNEGAIRLDWDPGFENEEWDNLRYNFIIPRVVNNVEVKSIGEFAICLPLVRNVIIPDSVTKISDNAFINCVNLATIVIPDSVTVVGEMAFAGCSGLDCIIIPDSVTTIGAGAFAGCSNLLSVIVPDSVHYTGSGVFCGCSSLQSVPEAYVSSLTGDIGFFFTPEAFGLLDGITIYTGSDGSSFYGEFANCSSLNMEIVLPEGVTSAIGAFDKCEKVKKISFPHSMVGYDNSDLLQYYFEDRWSWRNNLMWLWDYCYIQYNCPKLEEVSFTGNIYEWRGCIPVSNPADEMDSAGITYLYTEEVPDEILFRIEEFRWPPVEEGREIELNTLVLNIWPNDYNENEDQYDYNFIDMYLRHGVSGHKDLPSTLDGKPVEAIWFSSRPSYDSISIPDSVTHIISLGDSEFGKKYALYIGEGVEYIWSPLEGVEIIHVTSLDNLLRFVSNSNELGPGWIWPSLEGWRLYIGEKELTSIRLGEDKLPRFAFAHCDSIEEIYIKSQESIPTYDSCGYRIYDVFITNSIKRVYLEYDGSFDYIWYGSSTYEIDVYVFRQGSYVLLD